jgi:hypothetical protein
MKLIKLLGVRPLKWFKIEGIVLYPFVLFASREPHADLHNHERIHCDQIRRDGVVYFYLRYLWEYSCHRLKGMTKDQAYRAISYEREAYLHHHESHYIIASKRS